MTKHSRRLVSTELAAMAAGVTAATVRKWASRGKLTRYGCPGRAEYDLNEILAMLPACTPAHRHRSAGNSE
nr:hypothetical protein [Amycolatopsis nigrescens]